MMKILEVCRSGQVGHTYMGPVTTDICQLSGHLARLGHDVTVLDCSSSTDRPRFPTGVRLIEAASGTYPVATSDQLRRPADLKAAQARCDDAIVNRVHAAALLDSHEVIHIHDAPLLRRFAEFAPRKTVYTCHTPNEWCDLSRYRSAKGVWRLARLKYQQLRGEHDLSAIRSARLTIALGDHLRQAVAVLSPLADRSRIVTIPNGIEVDEWPTISRDRARASLGVATDQFRLLFVGRIEPTKGLHTLVQALRLIHGAIPGVHLTAIGPIRDRDYHQRLRDYCADLPVEFLGFISNQAGRFHNLVAASDVTVVPSITDNQPNVVLQSLAMNVPVVGSRVGAIPAMVPDRVGCLFEPNDVVALSDILLELHRDPERLCSLRGSCRRHIEANWTWLSSARQHERLFEELSMSVARVDDCRER